MMRIFKNAALLSICFSCLISCLKFRKDDLLKDGKTMSAPLLETEDRLTETGEALPSEEYDIETNNEISAIDQTDIALMNITQNEAKQITNAKKESPAPFQVGEKISYDVKLLNTKGSFGFENGSVAFEIDRGMSDNKDCYIFRGKAEGGGFGYKLRIVSESYIDSRSLRPVLFTNTQSGSEDRRKKLVFSKDKIEYMKTKHCKLGETCQVSAHYRDENGIKVHCKKCSDHNHYAWITRAVHNNVEQVYDLLSALFVARNFPLQIGGKDQEMILVDGRDLWKMRIQTIGEEIIETEIGKFDTLSLKLSAEPVNNHANEQETFRGLFGLKGDIGLWVDKESKIPIRIRGVYPLMFDVPIEILVKSIEVNSY